MHRLSYSHSNPPQFLALHKISALKIKYFGHSAFLVETLGKLLLFDPFIKGNLLASEVDIDLIRPDYILLTHGHGDHVGDTIEIAQRTGAPIISTYEVSTWLGSQGLKTFGLNAGGKIKLEFGTVKLVNAIHSSSMPDGSYGANPVGFVVWNEEVSFYVSGDTALTLDMKLIPMTCPKLDFAILCLGDIFTMGYEDAAMAAEFVGCSNIIGCHFDTFPPIQVNHQEAISFFNSKGLRLTLPTINQEILL